MNAIDTSQSILLVADDSAVQRLVSESLDRAGYAVDAVLDGQAAVQSAAVGHYALILIDLGQADGDGLATARAIRRLSYPRGGVPILALAATPSPLERDRWITSGLDSIVTKPIDPLELLEAVADWLEAADDPTWGLDARPGVAPPLVNRRTLAQLEEDLGAELMPDILMTFLQETERRLGLLAARVAAGDAHGAADEAHALKGSSGTFGAMALRQAVHTMEQSGRAGDLPRLGVLMPEVQRLVAATCDLLRTEYASLLPDPIIS